MRLLALAALLLAGCLLPWHLTLQRARFDHVIVLDITQSMNVPDAMVEGRPAPRIEAARHALREALLQLPCGSKVGWGVFTEYRTLLVLAPVEVCGHLGELRATLANLDGRMAWINGSEVAKGLHSGLAVARQLPERPSLVFVTDGHESPPLHPRHRPKLQGEPGEVPGLIVGVGQAQPSPIPKRDPQGRPIGVWGADEVLQADPRSRGRGGSVAGEGMADEAGGPTASVGATPGTEHLSGLREAYLRLLAQEDGLQYHHLDSPAGLAAALRDSRFERPVPVRLPLREVLAPMALAVLLLSLAAPVLGPAWRRAQAAWAARSARHRPG
ncbi:hypothetical protein [Aquincola tertiaricarbonis]|uniref:hypothetical protein n=1 Tax=Aquincola tertiaricarbonis TaxID=391953 RepID=UPI00061507DD|nr:hypothetical protein [Aquincola tertiaricarbonis]